jgi:hypothetical protein
MYHIFFIQLRIVSSTRWANARKSHKELDFQVKGHMLIAPRNHVFFYYICVLLKTNSMIYIYYMKYGEKVVVYVLIVRDNKLNMGDDNMRDSYA